MNDEQASAPRGMSTEYSRITRDQKQTYRAQFADNLARYMRDCGFNQSELARRATEYMEKGQVSRDQISKYLAAGQNKGNLPSPARLKAIAQALGCKTTDLMPAVALRNAQPSPISFVQLEDGNIHLQIDKVMDMASALEIMTVIKRLPDENVSDDG